MLWWFIVTALAVVMFGFARHVPRNSAFGRVILLSLLIPVWILIGGGYLPIDVRSGVVFVGLLLCAPDYKRLAYRHWMFADWCLLALATVHVASDATNNGFGWELIIRAGGEWIMPYLVGRWCVVNISDLRPLQPVACAVVIALGMWSISESISQTNFVDYFVGERPEDETPRLQERWGFKRAEGPTVHPIWFGMLQVLLTPWAWQAAREAIRGTGPMWLIAAAPVGAAGIFCSMSRGPWFVYVVAAAAAAICMFRVRLRYVAASVAVAAVVFAVSGEAVVNVVQWSTSRMRSAKADLIVDGEGFVHNETTHRLVLFDVYREAMIRAGLIGFGTERTTNFPVRVPLGTLDPGTMQRVRSIDSTYILMQLRFGLLGLGTFLMMLLATSYYGLRRGYGNDVPSRLFSATQGGVLLGTTIALIGEWMPHDFGFVLLWTAGIATSLREHGRVTEAAPAVHSVLTETNRFV